MSAARKLQLVPPQLKIHDPDECDPVVVRLFDAWQERTGEPTSAAILTVAQLGIGSVHNVDITPPGEYLSVKQAAAKYSLGERTIYRMVEQGMPVTRAGKAIRIKPRDLEKWLADSETLLR